MLQHTVVKVICCLYNFPPVFLLGLEIIRTFAFECIIVINKTTTKQF